MDIGFWINNKGLESVDFKNIHQGNPGCGGTEYLMILLVSLLIKHNGFNIYVYSPSPIKGLTGFIWKKSNSISDAVCCFDREANCGKFIIVSLQIEKIASINIKKTEIIMWHHNSISEKASKIVKTLKFKVKHVFLTKNQCKDYLRHPNIVNNATIIHNANISSYRLVKREMSLNNVTYIGSIVPYKNLHLLLLAWGKIKKEYNANLFIIGSGQVYSRSAPLGPKRIADPKYEKMLFDIIKEQNISNSVHFLGLMNSKEIEEKVAPITKVGIVNPGFNHKYFGETFCLSATQMGSFGIPVIGGNLYGLKTTIPPKCGYRVRNIKDLTNKINVLLQNDKKNIKYGKNYREFIKNTFDVSIFEKKWVSFLKNDKVRYCRYIALLPFAIFRALTLPLRRLK